jgi:hypothetical protein
MLVLERERRRENVFYCRRTGGVCPLCGQKRTKIYCTKPWEGNTRERYHRCQQCNHTFKSIEEG